MGDLFTRNSAPEHCLMIRNTSSSYHPTDGWEAVCAQVQGPNVSVGLTQRTSICDRSPGDPMGSAQSSHPSNNRGGGYQTPLIHPHPNSAQSEWMENPSSVLPPGVGKVDPHMQCLHFTTIAQGTSICLTNPGALMSPAHSS